MIIKLLDNTEINILDAVEYYRKGSKKWYLEINFYGTYSNEELLEIFREENILKIILIDDNEHEIELLGYNAINDIRIEYNKTELNESNILVSLMKIEEDKSV